MNLLLWTGKVTEEHVPILEELKQNGYDGVEIPLFDFDTKNNKILRKHLDRLELGCTTVTVMPEEANPISNDKAVRAAALKHLKNAIRQTVLLGGDVLCGPLTAPCGLLTRNPRTGDEWKYGVEVLRKAAKEAEKSGIKLALEALNRFETYFINIVEDAYQFAKEVDSPNFGVMWDTFHANIEETDLQKALEGVGDKLFHVHISEHNRAIPGEGHTDYAPTFKALKNIGYDGWLTIEAFSSALPELAGATCIWRKMFNDNSELSRKGLQFIQKKLKQHKIAV
ncbi:MAG: sugar phosphate isomerase/epimerase family protein [bacterium]